MNNFIYNVLTPMAAKLAENRYLKAIRDGFAAVLPLIIAGSFFTLINNLIVGPTGLTMWLFHTPCQPIMDVGNAVISATMNMLALLVVYTTAYALARSYKMNGVMLGASAVVCFFILTPILINAQVKAEIIVTSYLGSQAMFMAFIVSFVTVELIRFFSHFKVLIIHMPDSVPPAIANSFNGLIPTVITVVIFAIARGLTNMAGVALNDIIFKIIQTPFTNVISSPVGIVVIYFFYMLLWGFGIHSASIFSGIVNPVYIANITHNASVLSGSAKGSLAIMTKPFLNGMAFMGGAGNMLALVVAVFLVSKRKDYRDICKLGLIPAFFNISEPIMFGLPVVMNPLLIIPMILTTLISLGLGALATSIGLMAYTSVIVPWVTPPVLLTFLSTRGSLISALVALVVFAVAVLTYMPFVMALNKATEVEAPKGDTLSE
jgi:PTS system cellobiose-specific IIC component